MNAQEASIFWSALGGAIGSAIATFFVALLGGLSLFKILPMRRELDKVSVSITKGEIGYNLKFSMPEGFRCYVSEILDNRSRKIHKYVENGNEISLVGDSGSVSLLPFRRWPYFLSVSKTFGDLAERYPDRVNYLELLSRDFKAGYIVKNRLKFLDRNKLVSVSIKLMPYPFLFIEQDITNPDGIVLNLFEKIPLRDLGVAYKISDILGTPSRDLFDGNVKIDALERVSSYLRSTMTISDRRKNLMKKNPRTILSSMGTLKEVENHNKVRGISIETVSVIRQGRRYLKFDNLPRPSINYESVDFGIQSPLPFSSDAWGDYYKAKTFATEKLASVDVDVYLGKDRLFAWKIYGKSYSFICDEIEFDSIQARLKYERSLLI